MPSLAEAKADLYVLLSASGDASGSDDPRSVITDLAGHGAAKVYDHEVAAGDLHSPVGITVATSAITPTEFQFFVRVYVQPTVNVRAAQALLDDLMLAVEGLVTAAFGASAWEAAWVQEIGRFVGRWTVAAGREDFF